VHETNLVCKKKILSFLAGPMERNYINLYDVEERAGLFVSKIRFR
jgi:hypothetical protein